MSRYTTHTFTTASIPAGTSATFDRAFGVSALNVYKIIVTPSIAGSSNQVEIYKSSTYAAAKRVYGTRAYIGTLIEPMEDVGAGPVERNEGFIFPYEDDDAVGQLHLKIYNNHTNAQTYDVKIVWEPLGATATAYSAQAVSFNAAAAGAYWITGNSVAVTLPVSPADNDAVIIANGAAVTGCSVLRNGKTIMGIAEDLTIDTTNFQITLVYRAATTDWRLAV